MRKQLRAIVLITALVGSVSNFATKAAAQYVNPYTGNTFNNPVSSYLDTVLQGNMQTQNLLIQQSINRSILERSIEPIWDLWRRAKIKSKCGTPAA